MKILFIATYFYFVTFRTVIFSRIGIKWGNELDKKNLTTYKKTVRIKCVIVFQLFFFLSPPKKVESQCDPSNWTYRSPMSKSSSVASFHFPFASLPSFSNLYRDTNDGAGQSRSDPNSPTRKSGDNNELLRIDPHGLKQLPSTPYFVHHNDRVNDEIDHTSVLPQYLKVSSKSINNYADWFRFGLSLAWFIKFCTDVLLKTYVINVSFVAKLLSHKTDAVRFI